MNKKWVLLYMSNPNWWRNRNVMGWAEIIMWNMISHIDKFDWYVIGTKQIISLLWYNFDKNNIRVFPINNIFTRSNIFLDLIFWVIYLIKWIIFGLKSKEYITVVYSSTTNFSDILPAKIISVLLWKPLITKYHISIYESISLTSIYKTFRSEKNWVIDSFIRWILAKITISILQSSDINICTCKYVAKQLENAGIWSSKIAVNYLWFDLNQINNTISSFWEQIKIYDFCYLWRIEKNKWVQDIVDLVEFYRNKWVNKNVIIIGDWTFLCEIKDKVLKLWLSSNFNFVGFISWNEKYKFLLQSKIFIAPSYAKEWFGMTIFEAAYAGCQVIAYNNEIFNEVYQNISNIHLVKKWIWSWEMYSIIENI